MEVGVRRRNVAVALSVVAAWGGVAEAASVGLRGNNVGSARGKQPEIVGKGSPAWFGRSFGDSPVAINVWADSGLNSLPASVLGTLDPTAPLDRVDAPSRLGSHITGSEPIAPTKVMWGESDTAPAPYTMPDYVPPNYVTPTFPADEGLPVNVHDKPDVPIENRNVVARADILRNAGFQPPWDDTGRKAAVKNYPLVAPGDRMEGADVNGIYPVAKADRIPDNVARFLTESHTQNVKARDFRAQTTAFRTADVNQDGVISEEEFNEELVGRQGKSDAEMRALWNQFHTAGGATMSRGEYERLARTGFDVGSIPRQNVTAVLTPSAVPGGASLSIDRGFWGNGASCPEGSFVNGASLKRMPYFSAPATKDNTGLNAMKLKCSDGNEVASAEGPDGVWSSAKSCPEGEVILGASVRGMALSLGVDNSGINDLTFVCGVPGGPPGPLPRSPASRMNGDDAVHSSLTNNAAEHLSNNIAHSFAGPKQRPLPPASLGGTTILPGPGAKPPPTRLTFPGGPIEGGFMLDLMCPQGAAICGAQVRLRIDQGTGDDMGVTDLRFYCCPAH